jgi:hypothetical protein
MNNGQVALAFTSGYLMGRSHRMRWALALASAAAGRRLAAGHSPLDTKKLMSSEVGKLTEDFRGQLMAVGRQAAVAAVSERMDALSDRLEERTSALRTQGGGGKAEKSKARDTEQAEESGPGSELADEAGLGQVEKTVRRQAKKTRPGEEVRRVKHAVGDTAGKPAAHTAKAVKKVAAKGTHRRSQG